MKEKQPTRQIQLTYPFFRRPLNVVLVTLFGLAIYYLFAYAFFPEQFTTGGLSFPHLVLYVLIDQVVIECITTFILFRLIVFYAQSLQLDHVSTDVRSLLGYQFTFLPVVLLSFFVFNPVTQTVRFLLREFPDYAWGQYTELYAYSVPLYLTYLGAVLPMAYLSLNLNLLIEAGRKAQPGEPDMTGSFEQRIIGQAGGIEKLIAMEEVCWFEIENRICYARTPAGRYRVAKTLKQLQGELSSDQFVRLNRSVLANIDAIDSFTPWFNGKYVVRMKGSGEMEFTMSRDRARMFKARFLSV